MRMRRLALLVAVTLLAGSSSVGAQGGRTIAVQPKAGSSTAAFYADSWAVVIGIDEYQNERVPKLRYAVNDARAVERALLGQGFKRDRVVMLVDRQATKSAIERVLGDQLRKQMGAEDRLLVFSTAISMDALRKISDRLPAKHILYVMDACYSGYAIYNRSISDELLEEMTKKPAIQILTAGRQGDEAQERGGHGVFTEVFLRGVQGEAFAESGKRQLPQFGSMHGEGQFVFLKSGTQVAAISERTEPPKIEITEEVRQQLGSLALSARLEGVEVWLGDQRVGETRSGRALIVSNVPEGTHQIRARKPGHKDWEREVQVVANQRAEVVIDIEALGPAKEMKTEDGAEMVLVPAGEFWMGSEDYDDEKPKHRVYLDGFYIEKYEVTNTLYGRFIDATTRRAPNYWGDSKWNGATQPVVGVSWHDADAYCKWAGKRLPTEAEWEKGARGTDGRTYPWGDQWDASRTNSSESRYGVTVAVGSYASGVSPYGAHDMAGNVWEWVADWYEKDYYKRSPERNPQGADSGTFRVLRGGSWSFSPVVLRSANRFGSTPEFRDGYIGFRCARGLQ